MRGGVTIYPPVKCPVLMIHGLTDIWLMPEALNDTSAHRHLEFELLEEVGTSAAVWESRDTVPSRGERARNQL